MVFLFFPVEGESQLELSVLSFPCHFCSAKPPAGSALVKSFLPGAEVAKKIGMCLVFQHGYWGWGWHFSDSYHENLLELQDAKFTGVWEPQERGVPGVFISQAPISDPAVFYQPSADVLNPGRTTREVSAFGLQTW